MTKYVKSRRTVEHTWTCSACRAHNRGRDLTCPKCGKTKSDERYDESNKATVTDQKLVSMAHAGPNWDCTFCRFENRASVSACAQCGADHAIETFRKIRAVGAAINDQRHVLGLSPLPETRMPTAVYPEAPKVEPEIPKIVVPEPEPERTAVQGGGYRDAPVKRLDEEPATAAEANFWETFKKRTPAPAAPVDEPPNVPTMRWHHRAAIWLTHNNDGEQSPFRFHALFGGAAAAGLIALLFWLFSPWHEHVTVTAATWARDSELQHRTTQSGEGWGSPSGSFNVSCESRQHGTHSCNPYDCHPHSVDCHCHQVQTGEDCNEECTSGENGFSECETVCEPEYEQECDSCTEYDTCYEQCPTYDDWCRYNYYRWDHVSTRHAGGTDHDRITWPAIDIPQDGETYQVLHTEQYNVTFTNDHGAWPIAPNSEPMFSRYHSGAHWDIQVTHAGTVTPVHEESVR